ncbi:MAG: nucleotide sugar dehydrogenase, partial [Bdellovibrionales bacterium]|nr:nucleotide sugar dehydrogenase [Bdellovibrionales bacterium]
MSKSVTVIGSWHLGTVIGTCLADDGHQVSLWDQNVKTQELLKKGEPPIFEPGLSEMMKKAWGKTLGWSGERLKRVNSDWIVFAYDLEVTETDDVQTETLVQGLAELMAAGVSEKTNILVTSQVPVGTCRKIREQLKAAQPYWNGEMVYSPENLRLGSAITSMKSPDRVVLGLRNELLAESAKADALVTDFRALYGLKAETAINVMNIESAEMVKHALNAFLASSVVFANQISNVCEKVGADAWQVLASLKQDSRVGAKAFLSPGLGFSGATLARDVKTLLKIEGPEDSLFARVYGLNSERNEWVVEKLLASLGGSLTGKKIGLLGVTYKAGTSTVRRSATTELYLRLKKRGAEVVAVDPMADLEELKTVEGAAALIVLREPKNVFDKADAVVLMTDWPQFMEWNWAQLLSSMKTKTVIDTKKYLGKMLPAGTQVVVPG